MIFSFLNSAYFAGLKKGLIGLAVIGVLGWLVWVSTVQAVRVKDETLTSAEDELEKTEVTEPIAYGYREGALIWRLKGLKAVEVKETQESTVDRVYEMTFYKEGEPNLYASGDAGYWDKSREKLILRGNVVCRSADETTRLETDEMIWDEKHEMIECPRPLTLWVEENQVTADALYSDKDLVVLEFVGNVELFVVGLEKESFVTKEEVFSLESIEERKKAKKGITIECEYLFYNKETKYLRCYPQVTKTAIHKHNLDAKGRPPQYELEWDPLTGRSTWKPAAKSRDELFLEGEDPNGAQDAPVEADVEVEPIDVAMGWEKPPETPGPEESGFQPVAPDRPDVGEFDETTDESRYTKSEDYQPGRVFAHQDEKKKKIWCDFMEIYLDEKKMKARGDVRFEAVNLKDEERPPRGKVGKAITSEYTWVDANYMNYFWDVEIVDAWGNVHGWQNEKEIVSDNLTYSDVMGIMVAYGDVVTRQFSGEWLGEHGILEDIKDPDAREDAQKPTTIFSNSALSYTESDWSFGWGNVLFEQKKQKVRGQRVEYNDADETMVMFDDVQFKNEDGEWMLADKLTMDLNLENYLVEGAQSQARVLIPEEYEDDLDEWEKERAGIEQEKPEPIVEPTPEIIGQENSEEQGNGGSEESN